MIDYDKGRAATRALNYVENGWGLSLRRIRSWIPVRYFPILGRRPVNCRALFNNDNTVGLRMPSHRQRDINTAENMLNNIGVKYHKEQQQDGTISIIIDEGSINHLISYSRANWFDRRHVRLNKQGWPAATGNKTEVTPFGTVNVGPVPPTAAQDPAAITPDQWRKMQGQWNSLCGGGCALAGSSLRYEPDRSIVADSGKCTYKYSNRQNVDVLFDKTATPADMDKYFLALVTQAHAMGMKTINCTSTNEEFNTRLGAACAALGVTPPMKFEPSPQQVPAPAPTPAPAPAPAPSLAP
ncbi:MAG: hypothetical protein FWF01_03945, partial [Alphaproteobacteria bacterium]|nr:hypothetical protein [Alphaproteobacteria bacterium]